MKGTKTVGKQVGKLLATNRTCLYSRQLLCVDKLESDVWKSGQHVLVIINQSKRALLTWFILRNTSQNGGTRANTFKFIEAIHNCPAVWDVSSLACKDTNKNKQNKTEERADNLGFVQTFLFLHRFLFLLFFSSVSLLYVSATTLKKRPCCKMCLLFETSLTCEGNSLSTFRSFPTRPT